MKNETNKNEIDINARGFLGWFIPSHWVARKFSFEQCFVLLEIKSLQNHPDLYCLATNEEIGKRINMDSKTVGKTIDDLVANYRLNVSHCSEGRSMYITEEGEV